MSIIYVHVYSIVDNFTLHDNAELFPFFVKLKTKIFCYTQYILQTFRIYISPMFLQKGLWIILCLLLILLRCTVLKFGENSVRIENEAQSRRKPLDDDRDYHEIR